MPYEKLDIMLENERYKKNNPQSSWSIKQISHRILLSTLKHYMSESDDILRVRKDTENIEVRKDKEDGKTNPTSIKPPPKSII